MGWNGIAVESVEVEYSTRWKTRTNGNGVEKSRFVCLLFFFVHKFMTIFYNDSSIIYKAQLGNCSDKFAVF